MEKFEEEVIRYMTQNKMLGANDKIGVGVSGGADSMALLHFLNGIAADIGVSILAVHVNHNLRKASKKEAAFVKRYCETHNIPFVMQSVNVLQHSQENKMSVEESARILRYEVFEKMIKRHGLSKFALAHHLNDQAETILLHLFRGCGLSGVSGMRAVRGIYIRPLLEIKKSDLIAYNYQNGISNIEDESNDDNGYNRNFIRNVVLPTLKEEWRGIEESIVDFGKIARADDEYLDSLADMTGISRQGNIVRIPLNRFTFAAPVLMRILLKSFGLLDAKKNMEKKHLDMVINLAKKGINGDKIDLPNKVYATKEYEYITILKKEEFAEVISYPFKVGKIAVASFGTITVTKTEAHKMAIERGLQVIDADKMPKKARWRFMQRGDQFTKFGGGTKALGAFFTDKKVPARLRSTVPVLANGNDILVVGGIEIADSVKCDRETRDSFVIEFIRED
ncbi:MAG: tRNA lysidine(34) synthetase TilS [Christensenellaceae bacterium]|jgi:tRNA(Ile)-lysidine synthase|nr:tRNA lysidine(34) synthetase TilS [Christensenellaceae bacterium]